MRSIVTVTSPASGTGFDLTTRADVKADLDVTAATWDALFDRYVTEASLAIAKACSRVFARETVSELYRPDEAKPHLILTRRPVASVTSVTEDGVALTAADWELDAGAGLLFRMSSDMRTAWYAQKVVVVYAGGYQLPGAAPGDLAKAARALVRTQWLARKRDPLVRVDEVEGVGRKEYWVGSIPGDNGALPPEVEDLIAPYRDVRF